MYGAEALLGITDPTYGRGKVNWGFPLAGCGGYEVSECGGMVPFSGGNVVGSGEGGWPKCGLRTKEVGGGKVWGVSGGC